jgi:hypothetical protein
MRKPLIGAGFALSLIEKNEERGQSMVNELQHITARVVKAEASENSPKVTAKGGLVLAQKVAQKIHLWKDAKSLLPTRKDPTQGFPTDVAACAVVHGLLSGGRGFQATEALREDKPLLKMLGMSAAPSAETVEEVVKSVTERQNDARHINALVRSQTRKTIKELKKKELCNCHGFMPVWGDGTLLEVTGKNFDSTKVINGASGQLCGGVFVGPLAGGLRFALEGEGEKSVVVEELEKVFQEVIKPVGREKDALVLLDSLYGNEPVLDIIERFPRAHYIVGVSGLTSAARTMADLPEACWEDTGPVESLSWETSGVATAYLQCEGWEKKRTMVCRRFRRKGEMIWEYRAVATGLDENEKRVSKLMQELKISYPQAIWRLYAFKQGMENYWKELLTDMGLHHPPCAKAAVNEFFYGLGAVAWNLSVALRRLSFTGHHKAMRLWRLRRDIFDLSAIAVHHARTVVMRFVDSRHSQVDQLLSAMGRL